jgi:hypothetical protein
VSDGRFRWPALAALVAGLAPPCLAQTGEYGVQAGSLPPGLASVWRIEGRKLDARASAWSLAAFSTDGALAGVSDEGGTRVYSTNDGRLVRMLPPPFSIGQFAYSLAISSTGLIALGRVGGLDVFVLDGGREPLKFDCTGVCGPVSSLAFSRDGAWLAYQGGRSVRDPLPGHVDVVDLRAQARVADLPATAIRAGVLFTGDGRTLVAANVARVDDSATFGLRAWNSGAGWRRARDVLGAPVPRGSIGPYAFDDRVAAYSYDGRLELRDVAAGSLVWGVPLVPPALDAAAAGPMKLDLVVLARRADLVLSYESPVAGDDPGAIVLRRLRDGSTVAMYDVADVSALAISPDGRSFVYTTGAGRTYTALARTPTLATP